MSQQVSRTEKTSSDKQQIGFEYQYLYFVLQLLQMGPGDTVGYELFDDVHRVFNPKGITAYIQVKHTIETTAAGKQVPLPGLAKDLWKTISNWCHLIADPVESRCSEEKQLAFISKSKFILVTNRRTNDNPFVQEIEQFHAREKTIFDVRNFLKRTKDSTHDDTIKEYIKTCLSLTDGVLSRFIDNLSIVTQANDILKEIRSNIKAKMIPERYVDDVWKALYSHLRNDFFRTVQGREHQVLTFKEWTRKYSVDFQNVRTTLLPFREYSPPLPERLEDQVFVKELIEIGAVDLENDWLSDIADYTQCFLKTQLQLDDWYSDGQLNATQIDGFHTNSFTTWKRIHTAAHRSTARNCSHDNDNALSCFDKTMQVNLKILSTELGIGLSNGEFIGLANSRRIGWKYQWKGVKG